MRRECSAASSSATRPRPGTTRSGSSSRSGSRAKRSLVEPRMRNGQPRLVDHGVSVEQEIEIDRPRAVARARPRAPELAARRRAGRRAAHARPSEVVSDGGTVEERRLLGVAPRLGLAQLRDRDHVDSGMLAEQLEGAPGSSLRGLRGWLRCRRTHVPQPDVNGHRPNRPQSGCVKEIQDGRNTASPQQRSPSGRTPRRPTRASTRSSS